MKDNESLINPSSHTHTSQKALQDTNAFAEVVKYTHVTPLNLRGVHIKTERAKDFAEVISGISANPDMLIENPKHFVGFLPTMNARKAQHIDKSTAENSPTLIESETKEGENRCKPFNYTLT